MFSSHTALLRSFYVFLCSICFAGTFCKWFFRTSWAHCHAYSENWLHSTLSALLFIVIFFYCCRFDQILYFLNKWSLTPKYFCYFFTKKISNQIMITYICILESTIQPVRLSYILYKWSLLGTIFLKIIPLLSTNTLVIQSLYMLKFNLQ